MAMGDELLVEMTGRPLSQHVLGMPHFGIRAIMERATELGDCLHLEVGEPDFVTPEPIISRIALCTRQADLEEGCRRICHFLERRGAHDGRRHAARHA